MDFSINDSQNAMRVVWHSITIVRFIHIFASFFRPKNRTYQIFMPLYFIYRPKSYSAGSGGRLFRRAGRLFCWLDNISQTDCLFFHLLAFSPRGADDLSPPARRYLPRPEAIEKKTNNKLFLILKCTFVYEHFGGGKEARAEASSACMCKQII